MIAVNQLGFKAGNKQLLDNINFNAMPGEVLAIIGANGAGKSTLLKLLSREILPSDGSIFFGERDLADIASKDLARNRAILTQQHILSLAFTAKELVLMGRYPHFDRQPTGHDYQIVAKVMDDTGITHLAGRSYDTLSGGEQQRVQLARVMAQIADVPSAWLFLDEPTNGLDLLHQQQLLQQARRMAAQGFGVICVLHDINHAITYADKILVLKHGRQLAYGAPAEVIDAGLIYETFGINVKIFNSDDYAHPIIVTAGVAHQL